MQPFVRHRGVVAPIDRPNVDTDAIIPKQFLKSIRRTGFGPYLFDEWRYLDRGEPGMDCSQRPRNPDFVLNQPRYQGASVLLARENFGCGSSREHAVWALADFGFRALIAPSFADIFFNNCAKNGVLAVVLDASAVDRLFAAVAATPGYWLDIDLQTQQIHTPDGDTVAFECAPAIRERLLAGLDDIAVTLQDESAIAAWEARRRAEAPWIFRPPGGGA